MTCQYQRHLLQKAPVGDTHHIFLLDYYWKNISNLWYYHWYWSPAKSCHFHILISFPFYLEQFFYRYRVIICTKSYQKLFLVLWLAMPKGNLKEMFDILTYLIIRKIWSLIFVSYRDHSSRMNIRVIFLIHWQLNAP